MRNLGRKLQYQDQRDDIVCSCIKFGCVEVEIGEPTIDCRGVDVSGLLPNALKREQIITVSRSGHVDELTMLLHYASDDSVYTLYGLGCPCTIF